MESEATMRIQIIPIILEIKEFCKNVIDVTLLRICFFVLDYIVGFTKFLCNLP